MLPMVRVEVRHSQLIVLLPKQLKIWVHTDLQGIKIIFSLRKLIAQIRLKGIPIATHSGSHK